MFLVFIMQLQRKRHIGNDIVTIVFQDAGSEPFSAKAIRSQFQHVFIVVRAHNPNTANTEYRYVSFLPSIAISKQNYPSVLVQGYSQLWAISSAVWL